MGFSKWTGFAKVEEEEIKRRGNMYNTKLVSFFQIYVFFTKESCCVMDSDGFQTSMKLWDAYSKKTKTDLAVGVGSSKYAVENPICFNSPERVYGALKVR